jgi:hypothetical protein
MAESFLRACAEAVSSPIVASAVGSLEWADGFCVSVADPDTGRGFVPTKSAERG